MSSQAAKTKKLPAYISFDYLAAANRKRDPLAFYKLFFRIVRFMLSDSTFETVITNLDSGTFPPDQFKLLYSRRRGIETSFRRIKYTLGLVHFHAKKGGAHPSRDLCKTHYVQLF